MDTPISIPGLTTEPFHGEPIIIGFDPGTDLGSSWAVVYVNKDGERITGLSGRGDVPRVLVEGLNRAAERQRLKGRFEVEALHRVADKG